MNLEINNLNANTILSKLNEDNIEIYLDVFKVILKIRRSTQIRDIIDYLESGNDSIDQIIFFQMISKIIINKDKGNLVKEIAKLIQPIIPIIKDKLSKRGQNRIIFKNRANLRHIITYLDKSESDIIRNLKQKVEKLKLINITLFSNEYEYQTNVKQNLANKKLNRNISRFKKRVNTFSEILEEDNNYNNHNLNNFENISKESLISKILDYYKYIFPANRHNIFNNKLRALEAMTYEELFQLANSINLNKERIKRRMKRNKKREQEEEEIEGFFKELNISTETA